MRIAGSYGKHIFFIRVLLRQMIIRACSTLLLLIAVSTASAQTYYVSAPNGSGKADGSSADNAAADLSDFNWRRFDTLLLNRGTTLAVPLPGQSNRVYGKLQPNGNHVANVRLGAYGEGALPIIRGDLGSDYSRGWRANKDGTWSRKVQCSAGVTFYEGLPLDYYDFQVKGWQGMLAQSDGGYAHESAESCKLRVKLPSDASPNDGGVTVAEIAIGLEPAGNMLDGLVVEDVRFQGFSRQGINLRTVKNALVQNTEVFWTGGDVTPKYELGGGIQIGRNVDGAIVRNNLVSNVWDSPISPQLPSNQADSTIRNVEIYDNTIRGGWALAGIEVAIWNSRGIIDGVVIRNNDIEWQPGFANVGDGPDGPLCMIFNGMKRHINGTRMLNIEVRDNVCRNTPAGGIEVFNIRTGKGDSGIRIANNTMENVGNGGPRGRSGPGQVAVRGEYEVRNTVDGSVDQVVTVDGQILSPTD